MSEIRPASLKLGMVTVSGIVILHLVFALLALPALRRGGFAYLEDRDYYLEIAHHIAAGNGYVLEPGPHPTLQRMPAYPLLLAGFLSLTGGNEEAAALLQISLTATTAALCFASLRRAGPLPAAGAALAAGLHPLTLIYSTRFFSEPLSLFFSALALFFLMRFLERDRFNLYLGFSAAVAGAWLTRTTILLWAAPAFLLLAWHPSFRRNRSRWMWGPLLALCLASPWVIRNWALTGEIVTGTTWNARSALHGLRNSLDPDFGAHPREVDNATITRLEEEMTRKLGPRNSASRELVEDRRASAMAREELFRNPGARLRAFALGLLRSQYLTSSRPVRILAGLSNLGLLLLSAGGTLLALRDRDRTGPEIYLWLLVGVFWLFNALIFPMVRYNAPALPALALLAGLGLGRAGARAGRLLRGEPTPRNP